MLKKWVVQKLTICDNCQRELFEGSNCYLDKEEKIVCLECGKEESDEILE